MSDTLNLLTAKVLRGKITCGAYADAVHAFQHGHVSTAPYSAGDSEPDVRETVCSDCDEDISEDDAYGCNECGDITCIDCLHQVGEHEDIVCEGCYQEYMAAND